MANNSLAPLRGMKDLLPEEYAIHKHIENTAFNTAALYGYQAFSTPLLESMQVFNRTLGDTSDVISHEIYSFHDKGNRLIALRPEFTAGVMRAFYSNNLYTQLPLKLCSSGPLFRYDRPQEGRQRQFHQINFEYLGARNSIDDVETIVLAAHILKNLLILDELVLEINSLGCSQSRSNYQQALQEYFQRYIHELSADSQIRLGANPLRILDSKDTQDKKIAENAPVISSYYTKEAASYFDQIQAQLALMKINYVLNPRLVRGLDYYSHTIFEFTTTKLGTQNTILAGGRYDGLAQMMGPHNIPAIGFAAGFERISLMRQYTVPKSRPVYIFAMSQETISHCLILASQLRTLEIVTIISAEGNIKKRLSSAVSAGARYAVFIGQDETAANNYKLKDLDSSEERLVTHSELVSILLTVVQNHSETK